MSRIRSRSRRRAALIPLLALVCAAATSCGETSLNDRTAPPDQDGQANEYQPTSSWQVALRGQDGRISWEVLQAQSRSGAPCQGVRLSSQDAGVLERLAEANPSSSLSVYEGARFACLSSPMDGSSKSPRFSIMTRTRVPDEGTKLVTGLASNSVSRIDLYAGDSKTAEIAPLAGVFAKMVPDVSATKAVLHFSNGNVTECNFGKVAAFEEPAC